MKKTKDNEISICSSTAEYLTYVAAIGDNPESIKLDMKMKTYGAHKKC